MKVQAYVSWRQLVSSTAGLTPQMQDVCVCVCVWVLMWVVVGGELKPVPTDHVTHERRPCWQFLSMDSVKEYQKGSLFFL